MDQSQQPLSIDEVRKRVERVFKFLAELARRRSPVIHRWQEHAWRIAFSELPEHPYVARLERSTDGQTVVLRVRRPHETPCPPPPAALTDWVIPGWNEVNQEARHLQTRNIISDSPQQTDLAEDPLLRSTVTIAFEEDANRIAAFESWFKQREAWREAEYPVRRVAAVYQRLFELKGRLERESERLAVWVGDGILRSHTPGTPSIEYPLLLQRCELLFDSKTPAFEIRETADPPELCTPLLRELGVDGRVLVDLRDKLARLDLDLLEAAAGDFFVQAAHALFSNCEVLPNQPLTPCPHPVVFRDPVVFAAHRTGGMVTAIDSFLQRLQETGEVPGPLQDIIVSEPVTAGAARDREDVENEPPIAKRPTGTVDDAAPPLLTKPANREQEDVVRTLEREGAVIVQGPPGTGKTHTIANLLGHLLAQGKSVLVTSHTTKALRVLRGKVIKELQPLCVSVLDHDAESRQQLEDSVKGIIHGLSTAREQHLRLAEQCKTSRTQVWQRLQRAEHDLRRSVRDQYDDIIVGGETFSPSSAARLVNAEAASHAWLPGPLEPASLCPLTPDELQELYATSERLSSTEEQDLTERLPVLDQLPIPDEFGVDLGNLARFSNESAHGGEELRHTESVKPARLLSIIKDVQTIAETIRQADKLALECMNAGRLGGARREPWDELVASFCGLGESIDRSVALVTRSAPAVKIDWPLSRQRDVCAQLLSHLARGGRLGRFRLLLRPSWKRFLRACIVRNGMPHTLDDIRAVEANYQLSADRDEIRRRWLLQIEPYDGLPADQLGDRPEDTCRQYVPQFRASLAWSDEKWHPARQGIMEAGIDFERILSIVAPRPTHCGELFRIAEACEDRILPMLRKRYAAAKVHELATKLRHLESALAASSGGRIARAISEAISSRSESRYRAAWLELESVYTRTAINQRRQELNSRLEKVAPQWADAIRRRIPPHDRFVVPDDVDKAWLIRQLQQELDRRETLHPDQLQAQSEMLRRDLQQYTGEHVKHLAWARQHDRTDRHVQAALKGWLQTVSRRGYQSGVMSARLKEEAKKLLNQARGAVPVWIMPLSRVVESYDFRVAQFDVVIVDEASQCDMTGLVALGLAKQAVVVGDDKQVSPVAVGEDLKQVQTLIDEYLQGVSNAHLYTGKQSLYDMATYGFGKTIRLTEHFRCVPDIIQFSNQLSYDGEIIPLREFASVQTRPFVIAHRVADGYRDRMINEREALEVASLVVAATEQPEYDDLTFGVISMLGEEQAILVDSTLQKRLTEPEYARRLVLCGIPPQFQGDERDVVFITLVDGGSDGPLRSNANNDDTRKRFNVAASRARDQVWVVHSLNPSTDLKPADFRHRLIQHATDPRSSDRQIAAAMDLADSEFERRVQRRLSDAGFRIVPQWHVGAFRIDIVVTGAGSNRVAIECDGDRFHPTEKLDDDLARQRILERLGWSFIRIRGTSFFRDPEGTMQSVFRRLVDLGVEPIGAAINPDASDPCELAQRIRRRAEELRRSWAAEEESHDDDEEPTDGCFRPDPRPSADFVVPERLSHPVGLKAARFTATEADRMVLSCLREAARPLSRSEIIERIGIDGTAWALTIKRLLECQLVLRQGEKRGARYSIAQVELERLSSQHSPI